MHYSWGWCVFLWMCETYCQICWENTAWSCKVKVRRLGLQTLPFVLDAEYFLLKYPAFEFAQSCNGPPAKSSFRCRLHHIARESPLCVPPFEPGSLSSEAAPVKACRCCQKSNRHTGSVSHLVSCGTPPTTKGRERSALGPIVVTPNGGKSCSSSWERYITYRQTGRLFSWPSVSKNSPKPLDGGPQKTSQDAVAHPLG